ncbi:MAG: cob(I)yrinic acid a,c-diamide adenosyltransferase [Leptospiraceae bacterium]|nr:cob(I)yrinic acid a,c-diamide adenosyltransferase [Leptospiraceae bacterium]
MQIYTKSGDQGETSLANGQRVSKHNWQVALYGECDELNSSIGLGVALLSNTNGAIAPELKAVQSLLFEVASELAGFKPHQEQGALRKEDLEFLESAIDRMQSDLPELRSFILPGGTPAAAALHTSRTICRRLERQLVAAHAAPESAQIVNAAMLVYFNRLSDYLFVTARYANYLANKTDVPWCSRLDFKKT